MNRIWNSVVGKLWGTILLLVLFVLFIVTVLMLEFLTDFHTEQAEESLRQEAATIGKIVEEYNQVEDSFQIIEDILGTETSALIVRDSNSVSLSVHDGLKKDVIRDKILKDKELTKVYTSNDTIIKKMLMPSMTEENKMESYIILASPLESNNEIHGGVFIYQSLDVVNKTSNQTTNIVFLSGFIALLLTTMFSFFLTSRITSPLRSMREAASELAKGNFEAKVSYHQKDEIGGLATAFNRMGSQLKHHVEVINQEKEQLSNILTSMTDAVITFNKDFNVQVSNPQAELLMQKWHMNNEVADNSHLPAELYHLLDHVFHNEEEIDEELEIKGSYFSVSISLLYSKEMVRGAVVVLRDMTEQHQLDKMRSDFIANVSHELRTPISMLQGYSEAIIDDVVTTEEDRKEMIRIIYDESKRMGRLVTELLDLARLESGYLSIFKEEVLVIPTIERITQKFDQIAKEKNLRLNFEQNLLEPMTLEIDEDRMEQVLTNLIDNALRHTEKGSVTVRISKIDHQFVMEVEDTGYGIPSEDLPYVFERFYKGDKARTRGKSGTGLGLAIAKNIIERHDGNLSVESELGVGTKFIIRLPLTN
ncbi:MULTISPECIES: ATP-binding protein [Bacillaceae]|uniref:ATP-binding protein n=1 Tax=Bacillaceae TaxID=186817 RepID=UPI0006B007C7|nr:MULTISPECIES: ATP-binding protein [Bacillaceae]ALC85883.1 histidine kinase [Bacillus sp. FJAT-22090]KQL35650.1 histidine kinase [Psychrobacillus sp. FJAT-21963]MDF2066164.1 ATP-binding protein [Bacillus sp. Cr_A10]